MIDLNKNRPSYNNYEFNENFNAVAEIRSTFNSYSGNDRGTTKSLLDPAFYSELMYRNEKMEYFAMANYADKFLDNDLDVTASIGTETVGTATTITFSNPGLGATQIRLNQQQILIPDNQLSLNTPIIYSTNGGTSILVWSGVEGTPFLSTPLGSNDGEKLPIASASQYLMLFPPSTQRVI